MGDEFTAEERRILEPFVSNLDKDVFVLHNLPEVVKGALFSRYSRSTKSVRRLLLDEFIMDKETGFRDIVPAHGAKAELKDAVQKAQAFYDRVLDGYGDDSVGELGGAHIACEFVSNIAAKALENARIGGSPLEKSTRYVWFDQKVRGSYLFYREPHIMKGKHAKEYVRINNLLFDTYAKFSEPMMAFVREQWPIREFGFFDIATKRETPFTDISDEKKKKRATMAYNSSVKAKACDALRGFLPASTMTNVGIFGNGRFFQGLLTRLYSSPLAELQQLAAAMHHEFDYSIPSFVRRAKREGYYEEKEGRMWKRGAGIDAEKEKTEEVTLVAYDDSEAELIAKMLYPYTDVPLTQLVELAKNMDEQERLEIVEDYMGRRKQRRDRPGRALEEVQYTFDILADFGSYRDMQRHRMLTQERQLLGMRNGYDTPDELIDAGFRQEFDDCMEDTAEVYEAIAADMPFEAQYVVPFACNVRWYMKLNFREAMHLIELRSTPQGHPNYRHIAQDMFRRIEEVHPALAAYMKFVDMKDYPLGRISAESRKEEKKAAREKE